VGREWDATNSKPTEKRLFTISEIRSPNFDSGTVVDALKAIHTGILHTKFEYLHTKCS